MKKKSGNLNRKDNVITDGFNCLDALDSARALVLEAIGGGDKVEVMFERCLSAREALSKALISLERFRDATIGQNM